MKFAHTILSETFFQRFGDSFSPYLSEVGVDPRVLEQADIEIPEDKYNDLWEAAGKGNPNVGLEIGSQLDRNDIGALGHAISCAPSVSKALETLYKFIVVYSQESRINLEITTTKVIVDYHIETATVLQRRQDAEFAIAAILTQLRQITGRHINPIRVDFEHAKPRDTSMHKSLFTCPIYFNQPTNRIHISADVLKLPVAEGNERLYQALEPYLERQREARTVSDELLPRLTRIIASDLSSGVPSLAGVSEQLGLSGRTLQRRLNVQGLDFSCLLEDVRHELALSYITNSDYSVTEVAMLLGYAESGSFSRAFRRWTGTSPLQYRTNHTPSKRSS